MRASRAGRTPDGKKELDGLLMLRISRPGLLLWAVCSFSACNLDKPPQEELRGDRSAPQKDAGIRKPSQAVPVESGPVATADAAPPAPILDPRDEAQPTPAPPSTVPNQATTGDLTPLAPKPGPTPKPPEPAPKPTATPKPKAPQPAPEPSPPTSPPKPVPSPPPAASSGTGMKKKKKKKTGERLE